MCTRNIHISPAAALIALTTILQSCSDDRIHSPQLSEGSISVNAQVIDDWQAAPLPSRGDNASRQATLVKGYKLEDKAAGEPLYIFEATRNGFENSDADNDPNPDTGLPTRGAVVNKLNLTERPLGIFSYFPGRTDQSFYMHNERYVWTTGKWHHAEDLVFLWPGASQSDDKLMFFGYSPHNPTDNNNNSLLSVKKDGSDIVMHYKVPDDIADQHDLLVSLPSAKVDDNDPNLVPIELHHALTSVHIRHAAKSMYPGVVKKVTISNVVGEGDYDVNTGVWDTSTATLRDYVFTPGEKVTENQGDLVEHPTTSDGDVLGKDGFTLMMIPQDSRNRQESKPRLTIELIDAATGASRLFEKDLDINWVKGQSVVYNITSTNMHTEYTFDVALKGGAFIDPSTHQAGEVIDGEGRIISAAGNWNADLSSQPLITVTSYYTIYQLAADGTHVNESNAPARWEAQDIDTSTWIEADNKDYIDYDTLRNHTHEEILKTKDLVTTVPFRIKGISDHGSAESKETSQLRNASHVGTPSQAYDLSTCGGTKPRTTANCYIVNAPGIYRIPLVYGNAITDGKTNEKAYKCDAAGSNILKEFKRHDDRPITDPWIHKNTGADGKPLNPTNFTFERYQNLNNTNSDSESIVGKSNGGKNIVVEEDERFIEFEVKPATYPCNVVIALKDDNGQTLWTWHIWITGLSIVATDIGNGFEVMNHTLGELGASTVKYNSRDITLAISQRRHDAGISATKYVRFSQQGWTCVDSPQSLYYQFGRMAPLHARIYRRDVDSKGQPNVISSHRDFRNHSDFNNKKPEYESHIPSSIGTVIQNPRTIYGTSGKWNVYTQAYTNLWNNGTKDSPEKTVYDPCPPGYMVPPSFDFWKTYIIPATVSYGNDYENNPDDYLQYKIVTTNGSVLKIPRGVMITAWKKVNDDEVSLTYNARYTALWTGDYATVGSELHGCSFEIKRSFSRSHNSK